MGFISCCISACLFPTWLVVQKFQDGWRHQSSIMFYQVLATSMICKDLLGNNHLWFNITFLRSTTKRDVCNSVAPKNLLNTSSGANLALLKHDSVVLKPFETWVKIKIYHHNIIGRWVIFMINQNKQSQKKALISWDIWCSFTFNIVENTSYNIKKKQIPMINALWLW